MPYKDEAAQRDYLRRYMWTRRHDPLDKAVTKDGLPIWYLTHVILGGRKA